MRYNVVLEIIVAVTINLIPDALELIKLKIEPKLSAFFRIASKSAALYLLSLI